MRNALVNLIILLAGAGVFAAIHGGEQFRMAFNFIHPRPVLGTLLNDFFLREVAQSGTFRAVGGVGSFAGGGSSRDCFKK